MKKIRTFFMAILLVFSVLLMGCSNSTETKATSDATSAGTEGAKIKIGFSNCEMDHPYRIAMYDELVKTVKDNNLNWEIVVADAAHDYAKQANDIDDLLVQDCAGIIVSPGDSTTSAPACKAAVDKGIPVILLDRALDDTSAYTVYCGGDNYELGKKAGEYVAKQLDGKGNVVQLQGTLGASATTDRAAGFEDVLKGYPDIKIIANKDANFNREEAVSAMEDILVKNPKIDYVFAHNDSMIFGAIIACESAGRTDIPMVGADGEKAALEDIAKGGQYAATVVYPRASKEGVEALAAILDKTWDGGNHVVVDTPIITKENVDSMMAYGF